MIEKKFFKTSLFILLILNAFFLSAVVSYQITISGEMVTIPDLFGKTLEEAKSELSKRKLSMVQSGVQLHERLERGKVIAQDPSPDSKIKMNKVVKVILSAGKEKLIVPRLVGKNIQNINQILQDSGLRRGKLSHVHTPLYPAGRIIAQYPTELAEVARGARIDLLVSQGEQEKKFLMPDLLGKNVSLILSQLEELEFRVEYVRHSYYPGLESGIIIKQFPPQGFRIQKRNLITLEVSK